MCEICAAFGQWVCCCGSINRVGETCYVCDRVEGQCDCADRDGRYDDVA